MDKYKVKLEKQQTIEIEVVADDIITAIVLAKHKAKNRDVDTPIKFTILKAESYGS